MVDVTLKAGTTRVPFLLSDHHMEIYGSSERDQKWVVVNRENVTNNPHAMIVIWYDKTTLSCYARMKNSSFISVHTEIGCKAKDGNIFHLKNNEGDTYLEDGEGYKYVKDECGYFHLREHGKTYRRDYEGNIYMTNGDETVHLRNEDEIQITKDNTSLKFNIFFGEEQNVTHGNNELPTATFSTENLKHHQESLQNDQLDTCWNVQDHTDNIEPGRRHGCQTSQNPAKLENKRLYSNAVKTGNRQLISSQGNHSKKNMSAVSATSSNGDKNVIKRQPGMDHKRSDKRLPSNFSDRVEYYNDLAQGTRGKEQSEGYKKRNRSASYNTNGKRYVNETNVGQTNSYIPWQNPWQGVPIKGIANMGLTCYASGIIQILAQTELFLKNVRSNDKHRMPLADSLLRVLLEINKPSNQTVVERKHIQKVFEIIEEDRSFVSRSSNDCLEFLMYIFERLNRESKDNVSMFQIKLQNVIQSSPCGHFEFCDIQLSYHLLIPLYRETSDFQLPVSSCLMELLEKEEIFSGQELPCRRCYEEKALNNDTSYKRLAINHAPEVLILQIGRVETLQYSKFLHKQNAFIQYDKQLTIDEEHWEPDGKTTKLQHAYQLYGVVSHNGGVNFGHYACYVKKTNTSQWFHCNDSNVRFIDEERVLRDSDAFLLFYEKMETA